MTQYVKFLGIGLAWVPSSVFALGLGDLSVHSSLNQPLNIDIAIIGNEYVDQEQIAIALASPQTYAKAGLERAQTLEALNFEWVTDTNGQAYINLTTPGVIKSPYLDVLIEVDWSNGRMAKVYTILLDPPTFADKPFVSITAPQAKQVPFVPTQPITTIDLFSDNQTSSNLTLPPVSNTALPLENIRPKPTVSTQPLSNNVLKTSGRVGQGDTLWKIAAALATDTPYSVQQMMTALYEENPDAFMRNNINGLMAGSRIRMPSDDSVGRISHDEAIAFTRMHNQAWITGESVEFALSEPPLTVMDTMASAALPTVAPTSIERNLAVEPTEFFSQDLVEPRLRILTPEIGFGAPTTSPVVPENTDSANAMMLQEALDTSQRANEELSSRVDDFEEELKSLHALLALKNDEISDLRSNMTSNFGQAQMNEQLIPFQQESPIVSSEQTTPIPEENIISMPSLTLNESILAPQQITESIADKHLITMRSDILPPTFSAEMFGEKSFMQEVLQNKLMLLGLLLAGLGGISALVILIRRLFNKQESEMEEHHLLLHDDDDDDVNLEIENDLSHNDFVQDDESTIQLDDNDIHHSNVTKKNNTTAGYDDDLIASDIRQAPKTSTTHDTDELGQSDLAYDDGITTHNEQDTRPQQEFDKAVETTSNVIDDPFAQADQYIANKQYAEAEALLSVALRVQTQDHSIRLKLLQVFAATDNRNEFEREMQLLPEQWQQDDNQNWQQVTLMRDRQWPQKNWPQFPDVDATDATTDEQVRDAALVSDDELVSEEDDTVMVPTPTVDTDIEYTPTTTTWSQQSSNESSQFEISDEETAILEAVEESTISQSDNGIDFDTTDEVASNFDTTDEIASNFESIDEITTSLDNEDESTTDFNNVIETTTDQNQLPDDEDDIMNTKLDLARAYIEMGDAQGAIEILNEVLEEGEVEQQNDAKQILKGMSA